MVERAATPNLGGITPVSRTGVTWTPVARRLNIAIHLPGHAPWNRVADCGLALRMFRQMLNSEFPHSTPRRLSDAPGRPALDKVRVSSQ